MSVSNILTVDLCDWVVWYHSTVVGLRPWPSGDGATVIRQKGRHSHCDESKSHDLVLLMLIVMVLPYAVYLMLCTFGLGHLLFLSLVSPRYYSVPCSHDFLG